MANCAAFLIDVPMENIYSSHEIGPVLGLGAALAGRVIGPLVAARSWGVAPVRRAPWRGGLHAAGHRRPVRAGTLGTGPLRTGPRRILLGAFAAGLAGYALMLGIAAAHKQAPPRNVGLTRWLVSHHLTNGLAPYWEATSVTVDSGGTVSMLAIQPEPGSSRLEPQHWQSDVLLANMQRQAPRGLRHHVSPGRERPPPGTSSPRSTRSMRPTTTCYDRPFTIMVWHKNLLPHLVTAPAPARHGVSTAWDPARSHYLALGPRRLTRAAALR